MKKQDWEKIKDIFAQVLEQPANSRAVFLRRLYGENSDVLAEVESLLKAHEESDHLIEKKNFAAASILNANGANYSGKLFGNYKILREIGRGGMGAVFLAERIDGEFEQRVALKIVRQAFGDAELERRFRRERQILATLNHPNIAKLLDGGVSETGEPFLAMEYVEGEPLLDYAERQNLDVEKRLNLFVKVCEAVSYAHQNLIIHRDIKPLNVLVDKSGEPKLLDFGLAKIFDENLLDISQTETAFRAFTPAYASPEQMYGKRVTTATDVYSLGVVFYELLTGERPFHFENKNYEEILRSIDTLEPPRPSSVISRPSAIGRNATAGNDEWRTTNDERQTNLQSAVLNPQSLRGDLDNIALTALRKEPERRYQSVEQFARDIQRHLQGLPIAARPQTVSYRATKFVQRNKIVVAAIGFVILSLVGGLAIALWQANIAQRQKLVAEKRFDEVRQLSNALLNDIAPKIERLEGSTEARLALVAQSLKYLDSLAEESAGDLTLQAELATAYEKVGMLQGDSRKPSLSDFRGAIASLEKAQIIRRRLLETNPKDAENRRLLADNLRLLAIRKMTQSDVEGGFRESKEALQIYENLVREQPDAFELKRALLETQVEDATNYINLSRFAEAIAPLQQAAVKIEELHQKNANDTETERILAKCLASLGLALSWESRQSEAETEMKRSVAIAESLVARFPNDTNLKQELWKTYESASSIYEEINDALAFELCEKSRRVVEGIIAADRANTQARHNLSKTFSRLGISASNIGNHAEAINFLERAMKIIVELQERDSINRGYDRDLSTLYVRIGVARFKQRDFPAALAAHLKGAKLFEQQIINDPANTIALRDSAIAYRHAGAVHKELAKTTDAVKRRNHLTAEKENYQRALNALLKAEAKNALPESSRELIEKYRKDIEELEKNELIN